jgi:hypothetical protein
MASVTFIGFKGGAESSALLLSLAVAEFSEDTDAAATAVLGGALTVVPFVDVFGLEYLGIVTATLKLCKV